MKESKSNIFIFSQIENKNIMIKGLIKIISMFDHYIATNIITIPKVLVLYLDNCPVNKNFTMLWYLDYFTKCAGFNEI